MGRRYPKFENGHYTLSHIDDKLNIILDWSEENFKKLDALLHDKAFALMQVKSEDRFIKTVANETLRSNVMWLEKVKNPSENMQEDKNTIKYADFS